MPETARCHLCGHVVVPPFPGRPQPRYLCDSCAKGELKQQTFQCTACGQNSDAAAHRCLWCGHVPKPRDAVMLVGSGVELSEMSYELLALFEGQKRRES